MEVDQGKEIFKCISRPNGEQVSYYRVGNCCPTKSENSIFGDEILLDHYKVKWKKSDSILSLYLNMYDTGN